MIGVPTYTIRLYMAGDLATAKQYIRQVCYAQGLCVTVESTTFIYTGGEEAGFIVGFVNYPRFPSTAPELWEKARTIAEALLPLLNQRSALLVAPDKTIWLSINPTGARKTP